MPLVLAQRHIRARRVSGGGWWSVSTGPSCQ
jgi:hypothetical protein